MKKEKEIDPVSVIRSAGFRATTSRIAVLSYLEKNKYPVTVREVVQGVKPQKINQTTVYRMLESFKKAGLVIQVDFQHGHAHYELADGSDHHHVICTSCDRVEDFTGCEYEKLTKAALKQTRGFSKITSHSLEFFGMCTSCTLRT